MQPSKLRAPSFIAATTTERATWLSVVCYCVEQENGGRIIGASQWKDRQWQQTCGVTAREVKQSVHLFTWDGNDLVVWNYPVDSEMEVKAKRMGGRVGNERRWKLQTTLEPSSESLSDSVGLVVKPSHTDPVSESREEENRGEKKSPQAPQGTGEVQEVVEGIYQLYPRKLARLKSLASIRAALTKVDADTLRAAVIGYTRTPGLDREDGRFIPSPVTWFNEERWKDYLPKQTAPVAVMPVPSQALEDVRLMFARSVNFSAAERTLTLTFIERLTSHDLNFLSDEERARIDGLQNGDDTTEAERREHENSPAQ